jgi:hypothetical protein
VSGESFLNKNVPFGPIPAFAELAGGGFPGRPLPLRPVEKVDEVKLLFGGAKEPPAIRKLFSVVPPGLDSFWGRQPIVETLGYSRLSLRDVPWLASSTILISSGVRRFQGAVPNPLNRELCKTRERVLTQRRIG